MDKLEANDRWQQIESQTAILMEQVAHAEAEDLAALLYQRQQALEAFFQDIDYTADNAQEMTSKIQQLLNQDATIMDLCREQQHNILSEQRKLNQSKQAIDAYQSESASVES